MFNVRVKSMIHSGGTKDYDLILVEDLDANKVIRINRWGKVGASGQANVSTFNNRLDADTDMGGHTSLRYKKGYNDASDTAQNFSDIQAVMTYFEAAGKSSASRKIAEKMHHFGSSDQGAAQSGEPAISYKQPVKESNKEPEKEIKPEAWGSW